MHSLYDRTQLARRARARGGSGFPRAARPAELQYAALLGETITQCVLTTTAARVVWGNYPKRLIHMKKTM